MYAMELNDLLSPAHDIRAQAVFSVEGVPTVCFFEDDGHLMSDKKALDAIRAKLWNQNLISILLVVRDNDAFVAPVAKPEVAPERLALAEARADGEFSAADVQSSEIFARHPAWFSDEARVDQVLLRNLGLMVADLVMRGIPRVQAQLMMVQVMFICYLEHRGIVSDRYRAARRVGAFTDLLRARDRNGIATLIRRLKKDFNGDLLPEADDAAEPLAWADLGDEALDQLDFFLSRGELADHQHSLFPYDFRYIPVEQISGIYESFLADTKRESGAYYTPRHLAMLVVEEAYRRSSNILAEKVYDGACGSGILLTTAYRRMLQRAEAARGRQLTLGERIEILKGHIFGSDISEAACKVTAFSLYLSLLEQLQPSDIVALADDANLKLPSLRKEGNLLAGPMAGDFFSAKNEIANSKRCTIYLCNPPWVETKGRTVTSADDWAAEYGHHIPRRQLCNAFMQRAVECVAPGGLMAFILPVSSLAAPTSQGFARSWLSTVRLETLINFGDLRKILFAQAKQPTLVAFARVPMQSPSEYVDAAMSPTSSAARTFEYWVPKADMSFAFGRLTLHASDRHELPISALAYDNSVLTTYYWGNGQDAALAERIRRRGTVGTVMKARGWAIATGAHFVDRAVTKPASAAPLKQIPFLNAKRFRTDGPLFDASVLEVFPAKQTTVAKLGSDILALFKGPRIVYTDGITTGTRRIRAGFTTKAFSFNSSVKAITAPRADQDLLRFLSVLMVSRLATYCLVMNAYQVCFERERVSIHDIKNLPLHAPDDHAKPERAAEIVKQVADYTRSLEDFPSLQRASAFEAWQHDIGDDLIAEYFGLTPQEASRVKEINDRVVPAMQPSNQAALKTTLNGRARPDDLRQYQKTLASELESRRRALGGRGHVTATMVFERASRIGAMGVVRLDIHDQRPRGNLIAPGIDDKAVEALLTKFRKMDVIPSGFRDGVQALSDFVVSVDSAIYLVKPQVQRLWLQGEAYRDALRVVRFVQEQLPA